MQGTFGLGLTFSAAIRAGMKPNDYKRYEKY